MKTSTHKGVPVYLLDAHTDEGDEIQGMIPGGRTLCHWCPTVDEFTKFAGLKSQAPWVECPTCHPYCRGSQSGSYFIAAVDEVVAARLES